MKILINVLSSAILLAAFALPAPAQDVDKMPMITVTGTAEVQVAPDEVVFSLDVTKTNKDLQIAKRLNDEAVGKILELTRRFNIPAQNVKTDYISVEMKYESIRDAKTKVYDEDGDEVGKKVFRGYEVSKTVIVRLTDINRFEEFFAEVLKAGISELNSVKFETSNLRENKDKARAMAMKAAQEKAVALAGAINQTIGKAIKIIEAGAASPSYGYMANATSNSVSTSGSFSESVATFAPGTIKVEAQVTVSFLLN
ncbi:MAG: SIMPL domain-containing protein [Pyrinomonadaceae bacterium]